MANMLSEEEVNKVANQIGREQNTVISTKDFVDKETLYNSLIDTIRKYHPSTNTDIIEKAYKVADEAHDGQLRKSGEDYIIHPLSVALILADLEMDKETIVAGMLHDVVEDTFMTIDEISDLFGEEVALLVDGVTKLGQLSYSSDKVEVQAENLRKMFLAMAKDIRVIIIKLADRLHNMRTLQYMKPEKQKEKAKETMEIYAPLAQRLGISKVKIELDDLSLKYYNPEAYRNIVETIAQRKAERDAYVDNLVLEVQGHIDAAGIKAEIYGRAKHFFSIYRKMVSQNKEFDEIYDLFAIRIIVDNLQDCYAALGVMHERYTPIPGRFKDYIAMPKPNMYQSLHTTLIGPMGVPFEIQIRTWEMHRTSEYGIAAHWKYKESGEGATVKGEEEKISWLRDILDWQKDMDDNKEFVNLLKNDLDLFSDTVFCFTPQGDVKNFPSGSTPIDFAYSIHSAVGNKMIGAKVNGKLVPIEYELKNGDRVEILTSANSRGPSRDWLNIVKSTQARNKINQWFKNEFKVENIVRGKELLIESAKQKNINFNDINRPEYQENVMRRYGFHDWESCLAAVGHGGLNEGQIVQRMYEQYLRDFDNAVTDERIIADSEGRMSQPSRARKNNSKGSNGVIVRGMDGFYARFSKCCNPVPGDEIVGYVTRGRGLSIHRTDCINVINMPENDRSRLLEAEWSKEYLEGNTETEYMATVNIYVQSRVGILVEVSKIFSEAEIDIISIHSNTNKKDIATITVGFEVKTKEMLERVCSKLKNIEGVIDIERTTGG
ncbi:MAG: bifunctional (p)ppGpp synthetase/guanosine-3',5'-bis(diphosphate) 3'-pyrophosphohydrolase [Lachnospiraceae bacterium]|nr:bifunctional (p)ppGpp synthetase/guanosine-3',5'-bis(diphosphate) 3'-pyrophosphohydrolase [Lachnospiraceae bacterium]